MILDCINVLNEYGYLSLISAVLSPIISIVILFLTLRHDKKQFQIQLETLKSEHAENMSLLKEQHKQSLANQSETNRISAMPYLMIEKEISISKEGDNIYFNINFVNNGNGTAIELTGKYIDDLSDLNLCPMAETYTAIYGCAGPFDYEKSVVIPTGKCSFSMYQCLHKRDSAFENKNLDKVAFRILYKDLYLNQYEQEFMFLFSENNHGEIEIGRVSTCSPQVSPLMLRE